MKIALTILVVCAATVVSLAAYQAQAAPAQKQNPPDLTLTGCLVQGSSASVYLFDNAKRDPKSQTEKGARYLVVINAEDLPLRQNLNHEVEMTGSIELKAPPPPGQKAEEKDLSLFKTKSVTSVSDTCTAVAK